MRALPALLLLIAAPALAQPGTVDPALVGTWAFEFFEAGDDELPEGARIEHLTLTVSADGRLRMDGSAWAGGERRADTFETRVYTEAGQIVASDGPPARYELLGPDDLRVALGPEGALRFRRVSG